MWFVGCAGTGLYFPKKKHQNIIGIFNAQQAFVEWNKFI